jgi:hypothetical protein
MQHGQLVAQDGQFDILRVPRRTQPGHRHEAPKDHHRDRLKRHNRDHATRHRRCSAPES